MPVAHRVGLLSSTRVPVPDGTARPARMERERARHEFGQRVEEHLDALYAVARRLTRHAADADDLVAESVAKAWSALDSLEDWQRFRAWILRILHNHFVSGFRRDARAPGFVALGAPFDDEGESELAPFLHAQSDAFLQWWADPAKLVADKLVGEQILSAIEALPEAFRLTVLLVSVDGLGYDEAAAVLGVSPGTVRSRMNRGRTLLQKALWEHGRDAGLAADREILS